LTAIMAFFLVKRKALLWWAIHMPSAIALGADEILERHGEL